jgi:hypothetical protein
LVDYLLRRYGVEKFLELCQTCRPETFPDDVRRVLKVSLDELDEDYRADAAERIKPTPTDREKLLALKLGDKISPEKWGKFVEDYCAGIGRLKAAYCRSSVKWTARQENVIDESGERIVTCDVQQYDCDGERLAAETQGFGGFRRVHVVTPEVEFMVHKISGDQPWRLIWHEENKGRKRFPSFLEDPNNRPDFEVIFHPISEISNVGGERKIVEIGAPPERPDCIRVSWETGPDLIYRGWWDLDPKWNYILIDEQFDLYLGAQDKWFGKGRTSAEYEAIDGMPILKTGTLEYQPKGSVSQPRTLKLESFKFGPPPGEIFELSHYGQFDPQAIKTVFPPVPPTYIGILFWVATGWTILGLAMAVLAKCLGRASEKGKMDEIRKAES